MKNLPLTRKAIYYKWGSKISDFIEKKQAVKEIISKKLTPICQRLEEDGIPKKVFTVNVNGRLYEVDLEKRSVYIKDSKGKYSQYFMIDTAGCIDEDFHLFHRRDAYLYEAYTRNFKDICNALKKVESMITFGKSSCKDKKIQSNLTLDPSDEFYNPCFFKFTLPENFNINQSKVSVQVSYNPTRFPIPHEDPDIVQEDINLVFNMIKIIFSFHYGKNKIAYVVANQLATIIFDRYEEIVGLPYSKRKDIDHLIKMVNDNKLQFLNLLFNEMDRHIDKENISQNSNNDRSIHGAFLLDILTSF